MPRRIGTAVVSSSKHVPVEEFPVATDLAPYNVVAAYDDLEVATDAIAALREAGFDDGQMSIFGKSMEDIDVHSESETGEPLGGDVAKHIAAGGAGGGAIGAVLGAAGTAAVAAIPGVGLVVGTGALLGAVSGAFAGSTVGSLLEGEAAVRTESGWRQTFESMRTHLDEGAVVVGVHVDDSEAAQEAERLMRRKTPQSLKHVNDRGHEVETTEES